MPFAMQPIPPTINKLPGSYSLERSFQAFISDERFPNREKRQTLNLAA